MKCKKIFYSNCKLHIFYYKGKIHCLNISELSRLLKLKNNCVSDRLKRGWTYNQLLGIEEEPERKTPPNRLGTNTALHRKMPKGVRKNQELLKLMVRK